MDQFFRVSSKLKQIIGRDLITNDLVAIFELVKNSFDAHATRVDIFFETDHLKIVDNGKGMTKAELLEKWLFVAYSAKSDRTEDDSLSKDYRSKLRNNRIAAGNKGVGRFSCDRLGSQLELSTRSERATSARAEVLNIDWDKFEADAKTEFIQIPLQLTHQPTLAIPSILPPSTCGTIVVIRQLREVWDREKLLRLKAQLARLISPFDNQQDQFSIFFHAKTESAADAKVRQEIHTEPDLDKKVALALTCINGQIENPIFTALFSKTTSISIKIQDQKIISKLTDRGEMIYEIQETHPFASLNNADFKCELFYLNQAAKLTFARRMGIDSVNFGSVLLFRNGFRVFPIGEVGDDTFGIDRRKTQGYNRYLGTRDVIGHISVRGKESEFREASSRDQGLIKTKAYEELVKCFQTLCFRRLEQYVVDVTWLDPLDKTRDSIKSLLQKGITKNSAIKLISNLVKNEHVEILSYSKNLVQILDRKMDGFEDSLKRLEIIALKSKNIDLIAEIRTAEKRFLALKNVATEAEQIAKEHEKARKNAELEAANATKTAQHQSARAAEAEVAFKEETKRSLFLEAHIPQDSGAFLDWFHQIDIIASDTVSGLNQIFKLLMADKPSDKELLKDIVEDVLVKNQKILQVSRFVTKADFRTASEAVTEDIVAYFTDYVEKFATLHQLRAGQALRKISVDPGDLEFICKFSPMEIGMVIDNLISNSRKHGARHLTFAFKKIDAKSIRIEVVDDGTGLKSEMKDTSRIFERGYTTTTGAGLGLSLVNRIIVDQMNGDIQIDSSHKLGFKLLIGLPK